MSLNVVYSFIPVIQPYHENTELISENTCLSTSLKQSVHTDAQMWTLLQRNFIFVSVHWWGEV